ncbi:MAG TPA: FG-GAP-like repeat-containing protein, partial [Lacipirellula sp.]
MSHRNRRSRALGPYTRRGGVRGLGFEPLEARVMLAADYSDAGSGSGAWYSAARHEAVGPMLGVLRDANAAHVANPLANADAQDEDGVAFGVLRAAQTGTMTVYVTGAPAGARLDAWIDFNRDTDFADVDDQIVDNLAVVEGDNVIAFNVPPTISGGHYYARVRLSTAGNLTHNQPAADGEVEDYLIPIAHADSGPFAGAQPVSFEDATQAIPTDLDSDGDLDLVTNRLTWIENQGGRYGAELQIAQVTTTTVAPADVDGDGDMDFFQSGNALRWYESNGSQTFTLRTIDADDVPTVLHPVDLDEDGDLDLLAGSAHQGLRWYRNDGSQSFTVVGVPGSIWVDRTLTTVDMDGDNDLDVLAATTADSPDLLWLENDGNENFTERPIAAVSNNIRTAQADDLDDDGDLDVIAAQSG